MGPPIKEVVKEPSKKFSGVCGVSVTSVDVEVIVHHNNCGLYSSPSATYRCVVGVLV